MYTQDTQAFIQSEKKLERKTHIFATLCWLCLVTELAYYLGVVLVPFFLLGIYRMGTREMSASPIIFPDPALFLPCLSFPFLLLPLLVFPALDTWRTWHSSRLTFTVLRVFILGLALAAIVVSLLNVHNLASWGYSFEYF